MGVYDAKAVFDGTKTAENKHETIIPYNGKYANFRDIDKGVVVAKTGSGKTHQYEGKEDTLILVPRVLQTTVYTGEDTDYLLNTIAIHGAIITYDKFYGHYVGNDEFRSAIDNKKIKVIVDEAHLLVAKPNTMYELIYKLDAIFLSGTIEKFFRADLPRYKYKPSTPNVIYYTNGNLPNIKESLIFVDNATALKNNYPNNSVVGAKHTDHTNANTKTTTKQTLATMALREGVSVKNSYFKACMVEMKHCRTWSTKDIIQGLHRVRTEDTLRIVSKPPPQPYTKKVKIDWWMNKAKEISNSTTTDAKAVLGEYYNKFIKYLSTHDYKGVSEYGVICFLAHLTRDNYDNDLYTFQPYPHEITEPFTLDTTLKEVEVVDSKTYIYIAKDETRYQVPKGKTQQKFIKWLKLYNVGLIDKLCKIEEYKNMKYVYSHSRLATEVKAEYNKLHKTHGKKYSIDLFHKDILGLVKIEMRDMTTKSPIKRKSKRMNYDDIEFKVVDNINLESVKKL